MHHDAAVWQGEPLAFGARTRGNWPMDAASPIATVATSFEIHFMVS